MNFENIQLHKFNKDDYNFTISLGNKCQTTQWILRDLNLYKESFSFDYIPITPQLIIKDLKDPSRFFFWKKM